MVLFVIPLSSVFCQVMYKFNIFGRFLRATLFSEILHNNLVKDKNKEEDALYAVVVLCDTPPTPHTTLSAKKGRITLPTVCSFNIFAQCVTGRHLPVIQFNS